MVECSSEECSLGASRVTCGSSRLDIAEMSAVPNGGEGE